MNGESQITEPVQSAEFPVREKEQILDRKTPKDDSEKVRAALSASKMEDRFVRLKRHLRKRSVSIL